MDFKQADEKFRELKTRFKEGKLTEAEFKAQLEAMMVADEQGNWWIIGYKTERWYRHDGSAWVQADPPGMPAPEPPPVTESRPAVKESEPLPAPAASEPSSQKPVDEPVSIAPRAPHGARRSLFLLGVAALFVLLVGAVYVLRSSAGESTAAAAPANTTPVAAKATQAASATSSPTVTASFTPQLAPTAAPELYVSSSVSQLTLYEGPDTKYGKVATYTRGDKFTVLAKYLNLSDTWLLCKAPDGREGWLYLLWVDHSGLDLSSVPTTSSIPTPPPTPERRPKAPKPTSCAFC